MIATNADLMTDGSTMSSEMVTTPSQQSQNFPAIIERRHAMLCRPRKYGFRFHPLLLMLLVMLVSSLSAQGVCAADSKTVPFFNDKEEDFDDYYMEDEEEEYHYLPVTATKASTKTLLFNQQKPTEHQKVLRATRVDYSEVSLTGTETEAAAQVMQVLQQQMLQHGRLKELFRYTKTPECRALIAEHFSHYAMALAMEKPLPFVEVEFSNTCEDEQPWDFNNLPEGVHMGIIQNRTYQPERNETNEHLFISPLDVVICYGIMAHDNAEATIRFIEAVDEPTTQFIVHIDGKYEDTYLKVKEYANNRDRVVVLDHPNRVRVNWGGFSMVNATIQMLNYIEDNDINFTHFIHMASTAYPIASNRRIRNTIAAYPVDANFLHIILRPNRPSNDIWNYFVECDDRLHRIHRMHVIYDEYNGADFYTSSQWFIISKAFASFLAHPDKREPDSFLRQYWDYIQHVVVADESFFGTVLRNTHFCNKHHNWNFLNLMFDTWENEIALKKRDERKCVMPNRNHCGRSPTTITLDQLDILEMSGDLFARKFMDDVDIKVKDVVDTLRMKEEFELVALNVTKPRQEARRDKVDMSLEGHGTLIVAKQTVNTSYPLCLGLGETQNKVRLVPCFHDWVIPTLAAGWETGAVILEETQNHTRWGIGPCSSDGNVKRLETGDVHVTQGYYTPTGPRCTFSILDGIRAGRCLDGESLDNQPGGPVHVYPCTKRWNQFLSFGNGKDVPAGAIHTTVPLHIRNRIESTGREQGPYMCLGVARRGELDEEDWFGERKEFFETYDEEEEDYEYEGDEENEQKEDLPETKSQPTESPTQGSGNKIESHLDGKHRPLVYWLGKQLMATKCSNEGAVVEWILVPFIQEDEEGYNLTDTNTHSTNTTVAPTAIGEEEEL